MMMIKNNKIQEFKKLVAELNEYAKRDDISDFTRTVIQDLALSLRYQLEYDIINELIVNSVSIKDTIGLIDYKVGEIMAYKEEIYQKFRESGREVMETQDRIKLTSMERNLRRLNDLKTSIETKNLTSYIQAMNNRVTSSDQLVAIIKDVLTEGYNDYFSKSLIEDGKVDENVFMIIYSILRDKSLIGDLQRYVDSEKEISSLKANYEKDQAYLEMVDKVRDFVDTFKRFIIISSKKNNLEREKVELTGEITVESEKFNSMSNQKYSKIFLANQMKKINTDIMNKRSRVTRIDGQLGELIRTEEILKNQGFGEIIDAFNTEIINIESIPQKFALYIKTNLANPTLNVNTFLLTLKRRIHQDEINIAKAEKNLPNVLETISPFARKLITMYHDDVEKIVSLYEKDAGISKLVAFYVLNLLCSAKRFSISELGQVYADDEGLSALYQKLESCLYKDVSQINEQINQVDEDVSNVLKAS